jgi:hypothetical protein
VLIKSPRRIFGQGTAGRSGIDNPDGLATAALYGNQLQDHNWSGLKPGTLVIPVFSRPLVSFLTNFQFRAKNKKKQALQLVPYAKGYALGVSVLMEEHKCGFYMSGIWN